MFYYLLYSFHDSFSFLNVFRYITFRAIMAALTAFLISVIFGPAVIRLITRLSIGANIRKPEESAELFKLHKGKQGTPTMGGLLILAAMFVSTLLWAEFLNRYVVLVLVSTLWLGLTGLADDYLKHVRKCSRGLSAAGKFGSQALLGIIVGVILYLNPAGSPTLDIPFLKSVSLDLGIFYVVLSVVVLAGSSNAVNLTDGLDGLAVGSMVMVAVSFTALCYVSGNATVANYLLIPFIKNSAELTIFCASMVGASLGFLWFNCYPAAIFMGDVGSLALGGALGVVALIIKKEILLFFVGGIFVMEALSVIMQVLSFKLTKKRIFKIAPLHHHFQFLGWTENKVIVRFWIVGIILSLLTLVTLKVR